MEEAASNGTEPELRLEDLIAHAERIGTWTLYQDGGSIYVATIEFKRGRKKDFISVEGLTPMGALSGALLVIEGERQGVPVAEALAGPVSPIGNVGGTRIRS
jgi:hypothetical protein